MLVMLAAALAGDLVLLPALLAGPAGRFFKPRESRTTKVDKLENESGLPSATPNEMGVAVPVSVETPPSSAPAAINEETDEEEIRHLRLHFPRKDPAPRIKRSQ